MKLIIGLGNPGKLYEKSRHNIGFMCINELAKHYNANWKLDTALKGELALVNDMGKKAILLKPMTYMNLSGQSVSLVMNYFKIAIEDIVVISDDLDSPVGRVRLRAKGLHGGHNGHRSIILETGSSDYKRMKVGIGRSEVVSAADYVLQSFNADDQCLINLAINRIKAACIEFIDGEDYTKIASKYCAEVLV